MEKSKQELIAADLAGKIQAKQYQAGALLPSEQALCDLYGTSRGTVRKALASLTELGLIQKVRGKGSVVLDHQRFTFPLSGLTSFQELNVALGMAATTTVLVNQPATPPATFLGKAISAKQAIHLTRLRKAGGQPVVVDDDYLLPPVKSVPTAAAEQSLYRYLEGECGLTIAYAEKEITVRPVDSQVTDWLNLAPGDLVVVVKSLVYLADTTLFQLTTSYHRPDKFRFQDFARRHRL